MPDMSDLRAALVAEEEFAPSGPDVMKDVNGYLRQRHLRRRQASLLSVAAAVALLVGGGATLLHSVNLTHPAPAAPTSARAVPTSPSALPSTSGPATSTTGPSLARPATTAAHPGAPTAGHAVVVTSPVFGVHDLSPAAPVIITAGDGKILRVELTGAGGKPLAGKLAPDGSRWTLTAPLAYHSTYTVSGSAIGTDGHTAAIAKTFSTVKPASLVQVSITPNGGPVGVGATVGMVFPAGLTPADRSRIEQRLIVHPSVQVEGSWAWFERDGVWVADWRPKVYWPANISVHVTAEVFGIELHDGVYGSANSTADFTIGRDQVVFVDGSKGAVVVKGGGSMVAQYPATLSGGDIGASIPAGTYTVLEKYDTRLSSAPGSASRDVTDWAIRLSDGGEFIGAPADSQSGVGVNLSAADAKQLYAAVLPGDPVQVINTGGTASAEDTGSAWFIPWSQWQKLSAT